MIRTENEELRDKNVLPFLYEINRSGEDATACRVQDHQIERSGSRQGISSALAISPYPKPLTPEYDPLQPKVVNLPLAATNEACVNATEQLNARPGTAVLFCPNPQVLSCIYRQVCFGTWGRS